MLLSKHMSVLFLQTNILATNLQLTPPAPPPPPPSRRNDVAWYGESHPKHSYKYLECVQIIMCVFAKMFL